jgi:hypothetical protein
LRTLFLSERGGWKWGSEWTLIVLRRLRKAYLPVKKVEREREKQKIGMLKRLLLTV